MMPHPHSSRASAPSGCLPAHIHPHLLVALRATNPNDLEEQAIGALYRVLAANLPPRLHDLLDGDREIAEAVVDQVNVLLDRILGRSVEHTDDLRFDEFRRLYPNWIGDERKIRAEWSQAVAAVPKTHLIFAGLDRWKRSKAWADGYIHGPAKWLSSRLWEAFPVRSGKAPILSDLEREHQVEQARLRVRGPEGPPEWTPEQEAEYERRMADIRARAHEQGRLPSVREVILGRKQAHEEIATSPELEKLLLGHVGRRDVTAEVRQDQRQADQTNQSFLFQQIDATTKE